MDNVKMPELKEQTYNLANLAVKNSLGLNISEFSGNNATEAYTTAVADLCGNIIHENLPDYKMDVVNGRGYGTMFYLRLNEDRHCAAVSVSRIDTRITKAGDVTVESPAGSNIENRVAKLFNALHEIEAEERVPGAANFEPEGEFRGEFYTFSYGKSGGRKFFNCKRN